MYDLFLGNTTYTLLLALTAIFVGRVLGPDGYGLYTVALIIPPFLYNAIRFGLDTAATRYASRLLSEGREKEANLFVYAMVLVEVALAVVFTVVFLFLSGVLSTTILNRPGIGATILPISILSIVGQSAYTVTASGLIGLGRYGNAALLQALQGLTKLVVSVVLVLTGFGVAGAVAGYTASFFVSGILGVILVMSISGAAIPKGIKADLTTGLHYGWPVYLSVLASGFVAPAINTVLALTVSNSQIGGYSAAGTFNSLITLFTYPIATALFPLFSRKVDDPEVLGRTYRTSVWFTALLVVPVASFIMAFSGPLMLTFYGRAYAFGADFLTVFASTNLLVGLGSLAWSALLNGIGRTRDALVSTAIGSGVSVVAAVAMIRTIGTVGAIAGQVVGTGVMLTMGVLMVRRRLRARLGLTSPWKIYLSAWLAAAAALPIALFVGQPEISLVFGAVVFVAVFIPILAVFRTLNDEAIDALRGYLSFSKMISQPLEIAIRYYRLIARG
jgi:O-antigen/teichoic acid export membrane protein